MTLRSIETKEIVQTNNDKAVVKDVKPKDESIRLAKHQKFNRMSIKFNIQSVTNKVLDTIEMTKAKTLYYIGRGDDKQFCGTVLQLIPTKTYVTIDGGVATYYSKPFMSLKVDRYLVAKVGNQSKDYMVIVAANGCLIAESGATVLLKMPVFVVEQTGDYYFLNHGQRNINLGPGAHLVLHNKEESVIFVTIQKKDRKPEVQKTKSNDQKKDSKQVIIKESKNESKDRNVNKISKSDLKNILKTDNKSDTESTDDNKSKSSVTLTAPVDTNLIPKTEESAHKSKENKIVLIEPKDEPPIIGQRLPTHDSGQSSDKTKQKCKCCWVWIAVAVGAVALVLIVVSKRNNKQ